MSPAIVELVGAGAPLEIGGPEVGQAADRAGVRVGHPHVTAAHERDPPAVGCPGRARVRVEAGEGVEAIERDDVRGADRAVAADRDDHELGVARRSVRRTGQPAERQPRSVRRPCGTRVVGGIRSGYFEPTGVLARPDEVDVAVAVQRYPPVGLRQDHPRRADWVRGLRIGVLVGQHHEDRNAGRRGDDRDGDPGESSVAKVTR